jgi:hypothetical protein
VITREQALKLGYSSLVHYTGPSGKRPSGSHCITILGPKGGIVSQIVQCRVSGMAQTWKRNPERFRLPVKFGLRESTSITESTAGYWHLASECEASYLRIQCERCTWRSWLPGPGKRGGHDEMIMTDGKPCPNVRLGGCRHFYTHSIKDRIAVQCDTCLAIIDPMGCDECGWTTSSDNPHRPDCVGVPRLLYTGDEPPESLEVFA